MSNLREELCAVINKCSAENASNTPDFILAAFLEQCLAAFAEATKAKEQWYGARLAPTGRSCFPKLEQTAVCQFARWLASRKGYVCFGKGCCEELMIHALRVWCEDQGYPLPDDFGFDKNVV